MAPTQPKPPTLAELEQELVLLEIALTSDEAKDREVAEQLFAEFLPQLEKKIDGYITTINKRKHQARYQRQEAERLKDLAQKNERSVEWLTQKLQGFLERRVEQMGEERGKRLEGLYSRVVLYNNGGLTPVWINPDLAPQDFPEEYTETVSKVQVKKEALQQEARKQGEIRDLSGRLIAKTLPRGKHLRFF